MKFLNHLTLGQYVPASSIVHSIDPRAKIISVVVVLSGIFAVNRIDSFLLWAVVLFVVVKLSKLPLSMVLRSARPVIILVLFTSLIHLFFTKGEIIFQYGFLTITLEGVMMAVKIGLRLVLLVMYAGILTLTTSPTELSDGLESIFSPLKRFGFPAHEMAMMMTIAIRFIPTLLDETDRIVKAQIARGAELDQGGIIKRIRSFIPILVPLFVIVFQRADELAVAMESRNYKGGEGRTRMYPLVWSFKESIFMLFTILTTLLIILLDKRIWL
ncbi:MAG: energy-coupling factor transporter transmembrane protein EcfT [Thermovirga sp.]|nr:energy-coupling factor transporter transmembrane protein EcfT [Thermovirga sp.]